MYYIVEKHGMFLSTDYDYSSVWKRTEDQAYQVRDKEAAKLLAVKYEGKLLQRNLPN